MKIKLFKNKKTFKKGGIHRDPDIYWGITLLTAFIIVIVAVIFAFNLFEKINGDSIAGNEDNTSQTNIIKKERIDEILKYFLDRKQKSDQIIVSPAPVVDPSL
ncbi:MAG: hypothetical protein ABIS26_02005 [Candidatus Paceibacterota bacterium]